MFLAMTGKCPKAHEIAPPGVFKAGAKRGPTEEQEEAAAKLAWDGLLAAAEAGCLR